MDTRTQRDLSAVFDPRSVAIVGASNDDTKYGNWLSVQALRMRDHRDVHLVNRRGAPVLGYPSIASLRDIPGGTVDLVVITVPSSEFEQTVEEALSIGARTVIGVTAGFAELGEDGRLMQERIVSRVRDAGALLIGPNCLGISDSTSGLTLASNPLPEGRVTLLSQSGNMALELARYFGQRDMGFSRFVSLGNQADLSAADFVGACVDHEGTDVIAVYCEDFGDGLSFVAAAAQARLNGKPVILLTVGGSEASVRGAQSHTGSLTSSSDVLDAACREAGIYRVHTPRELADLSAVLLATGPRRIRKVVVIADGGGHAAVAADVLDAASLNVPELVPALRQHLESFLPPSAGTSNPIDLAGAGERDITSFATVLDAVLSDDELDAAVITGYFGGYGDYGPILAEGEIGTAHQMVAVARSHGKPVIVQTMRPDSRAAAVLAEGGIPVFEAIEDGARALATLGLTADPGRHREQPTGHPVRGAHIGEGYWESRELVRSAGVSFPAARMVQSREEAVAAATAIGYPVVLKALGLLHKSDSGGVALGLACPSAVGEAFDVMDGTLAATCYCVEAMADLKGGIELIVGMQCDPRFGPVTMVGLGGVYTEVFADVTFALAPVDAGTARELLLRLHSSPLLTGVRGRAAVDIDAAAEAIAAISALAARHPEIQELEVNPLLVTPSGALGLDARIILKKTINNHERHN